MTAIPQTLYKCDRCAAAEHIAATTNPPTHERVGGPSTGWLCLRIGIDPSTPPSHLCPVCTAEFRHFMTSG
jgi:hypothetical protein